MASPAVCVFSLPGKAALRSEAKMASVMTAHVSCGRAPQALLAILEPKGRPGLNDGPFFFAALYTAGGVGELYQQRSTLLLNRYTEQTTTPSGLGLVTASPVMTKSRAPAGG
jgi:hypothetical protein